MFGVLLLPFLCHLSPAPIQGSGSNSPALIKMVVGLRKAGLCMEDPGPCFGGRRPPSRYEVAAYASDALGRTRSYLGLSEPGRYPLFKPNPQPKLFKAIAQSFYSVELLVRSYRSELQEMGCNYSLKTQQLNEMAQLLTSKGFSIERVTDFADVPKNHWAARAVFELQDLGILFGYPDRKFKG